MKLFTSSKLLACALAVLGLIWRVHAAEAKDLKGYRIEQETEASGKYLVYVSPTSFYCKSAAFGFTIFAVAPKWTVTAFRDDSRNWVQTPLSEFLKSDFLFMNRLNYSADLQAPTKSVEIQREGHRTIVYNFPPVDNQDGNLFAYDREEDRKARRGKLTPVLTSLVTGYPQTTSSLANKLYEINPQLKGLPINISITDAQGKLKLSLHTIKISRDVLFSESLMTVPKGYRQGIFNKKFFISKSQNEFMHEMYNGMMAP